MGEWLGDINEGGLNVRYGPTGAVEPLYVTGCLAFCEDLTPPCLKRGETPSRMRHLHVIRVQAGLEKRSAERWTSLKNAIDLQPLVKNHGRAEDFWA